MYKLYREKINGIIRKGNYLMIRTVVYIPMVMMVTAYIIVGYLVWKDEKPSLSKKDCMIAEISPDFTTKEKELCRELKRKK
jgi:hypothetical protein